MKTRVALLILSGLGLFFLSSCQCDEDILKSNTWILQKYGPEDALISVLDPGSTSAPSPGVVTLTFQDGSVSGNDGCNSFFGVFEQTGCKLQVDSLQNTLVLCSEEIMAQAGAFQTILKSVSSFKTKKGRLRLHTEDDQVLLFHQNE